MSGASVSEIHGYPLRPPGFEEPLFATPESRRATAEHLLASPWLSRASELVAGSAPGTAARAVEEPVELRRRSGQVVVVRTRSRRSSWRRRRIIEVVARWRDVRRWWDEERRVDRLLFRVAVGGGELVDLALDRGEAGGWLLVGVVD